MQARTFILVGFAALAVLTFGQTRGALAAPGPTTTTFGSDPSWPAFTDYPAAALPGSSGASLGNGQYVCLNQSSPYPCPTGATDFGSPYTAWTSDLGSIPGAGWIWRSGVTAVSMGADLAQVVFSRKVIVQGQPSSAWIAIAADDYAEIRVNGALVGSIGSASPAGPEPAYGGLTTFDITDFVKAGANTVAVLARNGPAAAWGICAAPCAYSSNPGGVVFGGAITVGSPPPPAPPGAVRIRPFACEANGGQLVPAGAPLYVSGGYFSGTHGLVRALVQADATTIREQRAGAVAVASPVFGQVYPVQPGLWRADWVPLGFEGLGAGESATYVFTFATRHRATDLILPWAEVELGLDYDGTGLRYFDHFGEPVVVTCTVTGQ